MSEKKLGLEVNLRAISDELEDPGLAAGRQLRALTDAVVLRDSEELPGARASVTAELGTDAGTRAIAVVGNFEMMNRLLDAMALGPPSDFRRLEPEIGVAIPERFR